MALLEIKDLYARVEGTPVLQGFNLTMQKGEIHALMGPNGAGKSTLAKVLAGHPAYEVTGGSVRFLGKDLLEMEPDERAHAGLFMSFQYPIEVPGVSNFQFMFQAYNSGREDKLSETAFEKLYLEKMKLMDIKGVFKERNLNEGFSGGEKKRNEILQMALLEPKLALLDETDSGLDIDAMRVVAKGINGVMHPEMGLLLITHYQRLLDYITPDVVHVMVEGAIVQSGGAELALKLEEQGYDWLTNAGVA